MYDCETVDLTYFDRAVRRFDFTVELNCSGDQLFQVFEDEIAWTVWAGGIQNVTWTSSKPYGVGTTRTVDLSGNLTLYERFIAWESGRHMAFCLDGTNRKTWKIFAENYDIKDLGEGQCQLQWTVAYDGAGIFGLLDRLIAPFMKRALGGYMKGLAKYVDERF